MSKVTVARALADKFGTNFQRAKRFVDEVGENQARAVLGSSGQPQGARRALPQIGDNAVRAADDAGRTLPSGKALGAGAATAGLGGGALLWKQESRKQDEADAKQSETFQQSLEKILSSDLPPDVRAQLAESAAKATGGSSSGGSDNPLDDLLPDVPSLGINDGLRTILFILIALGVIYVLVDDSTEISLPGAEADNGGS